MKQKKNKKEKIIYCWFCGCENPKKNKKCYSCNHSLKEKDSSLFVFLFGEVKGEMEDGIFAYLFRLASSFLHLHLYGSVMGLAITFAVVSSVLNFTEPEDVSTTTDTYSLSIVEEEPKEEVPEEPKEEESTPTPATPSPKPATPTPKPTTPTTPTTPATPQEEEKPKELYCPTDYTLRSDGKCELVKLENAYYSKECPSGYEFENDSSGGYCRNIVAQYMPVEYYCASTLAEFKQHGASSCDTHADVVSLKGTLSQNKCTYQFFDAEGNASSCMDFGSYDAFKRTLSCPSGTVHMADYCYEKRDYTIKYFCIEGEELVNTNQCKHTYVFDAQER